METPFFSLFFVVFKHIPLVESDPNFMGGDRSEFRPIVSENINFSYHLFARGREKERDWEEKVLLHKILVASKVRGERQQKARGNLLLKGGPGSRMKQRETTTEEEK